MLECLVAKHLLCSSGSTVSRQTFRLWLRIRRILVHWARVRSGSNGAPVNLSKNFSTWFVCLPQLCVSLIVHLCSNQVEMTNRSETREGYTYSCRSATINDWTTLIRTETKPCEDCAQRSLNQLNGGPGTTDLYKSWKRATMRC